MIQKGEMKMTKKEFVKKIIEVVQADADTAIVGVSGCSYSKTEIGRKCTQKKFGQLKAGNKSDDEKKERT